MAKRVVVSDKGWVDVKPDGSYEVLRPFVIEDIDPGSFAAGIILGQLCCLMDNSVAEIRQHVSDRLIHQVDLEAMARGYKVTVTCESDIQGIVGVVLERVSDGL